MWHPHRLHISISLEKEDIKIYLLDSLTMYHEDLRYGFYLGPRELSLYRNQYHLFELFWLLLLLSDYSLIQMTYIPVNVTGLVIFFLCVNQLFQQTAWNVLLFQCCVGKNNVKSFGTYFAGAVNHPLNHKHQDVHWDSKEIKELKRRK